MLRLRERGVCEEAVMKTSEFRAISNFCKQLFLNNLHNNRHLIVKNLNIFKVGVSKCTSSLS